jgi:hypothetical protein
MTISKKIIAGFAAVTAIVALFGGLCVYEFSAIKGQAKTISQGVPSLLAIEEMRARTLTNYAQVLRHIVTTDAGELSKPRSTTITSAGSSKVIRMPEPS